jgi:hypothetical protein
MKHRWIVGGVMLVLLALLVACSLFGDNSEDVGSLAFVRDEVMLEVTPDFEMRTLSVKYLENEGVIGGDFFDRIEEILDVFEGDVGGSENGEFTLAIGMRDGKVYRYRFDEGSESEEFMLISSFYDDVVLLFSEDVY